MHNVIEGRMKFGGRTTVMWKKWLTILEGLPKRCLESQNGKYTDKLSGGVYMFRKSCKRKKMLFYKVWQGTRTAEIMKCIKRHREKL